MNFLFGQITCGPPWLLDMFGTPTMQLVALSNGTHKIEVSLPPRSIAHTASGVTLELPDGSLPSLGSSSEPSSRLIWESRTPNAPHPTFRWVRQPVHVGESLSSLDAIMGATFGDRVPSEALLLAPFAFRNDPSLSFLTPFSHQPLRAPIEVEDEDSRWLKYHITTLSNQATLHAGPPPTAAHAERLQICLQLGRHTPFFDKWMTPSDLDSYICITDADADALWDFNTAMCQLDVPTFNETICNTRHRPWRQLEYTFTHTIRNILRSGGLMIGRSIGFRTTSAFTHSGCACCNAALHIGLYVQRGLLPEHTGATERHFRQLLGLPYPGPLVMCTAERAYPGIKHQDT